MASVFIILKNRNLNFKKKAAGVDRLPLLFSEVCLRISKTPLITLKFQTTPFASRYFFRTFCILRQIVVWFTFIKRVISMYFIPDI